MQVASTAVLAFLLAVAAWSDVRQLRIPNLLVFGGTGVALAFAAVGGWHETALALAGFVVCLLMLLPFHLLRMMGAGDVKLMGMVGAFLGPAEGFYATLATMLAGGAVSVWWLWRVRRSRAGSSPEGTLPADLKAMRVPYGIAILLGTLGWISLRLPWWQ